MSLKGFKSRTPIALHFWVQNNAPINDAGGHSFDAIFWFQGYFATFKYRNYNRTILRSIINSNILVAFAEKFRQIADDPQPGGKCIKLQFDGNFGWNFFLWTDSHLSS